MTRRPLHSLVWTEQLDAAARILAVSPSRVRSLCRSNEIDLPPPGYWAKIAAGAPPKRRDLRIDTLRAEAIVRLYSGSVRRAAPQVQEHCVSPTGDTSSIAADLKPTTTLAKLAYLPLPVRPGGSRRHGWKRVAPAGVKVSSFVRVSPKWRFRGLVELPAIRTGYASTSTPTRGACLIGLQKRIGKPRRSTMTFE